MKWPRRSSMLHMIPAEIAIHDAIIAVEKVGCDVLLTDAVILLSEAATKVADFVDREHPDEAEIEIV